MKRWLWAGTALLQLVVMVAGLMVLQARDSLYPQHCNVLFSLDAGKSTLRNDQLVERLQHWVVASGSELYLVRVPAGEAFEARRDLVSFGLSTGTASIPLRWLDPRLSGSVVGLDQLGGTSLSAPYCARVAGEGAIQGLDRELAGTGAVAGGVHLLDFTDMAMQALLHSGMASLAIVMTASLASLLLAFQLRRAGADLISFAEGWSWWRLTVRGVGYFCLAYIGCGLTAIAGGALWILARGRADLVGEFASWTATNSARLGLVLVLGALAALPWAVPTRRKFADRVPPQTGYALAAQVLKAVALCLTAALAPGLIAGIVNQRADIAESARWSAFDGFQSIRVSPAPSHERTVEAEPALAAALTGTPTHRPEVAISYAYLADVDAGFDLRGASAAIVCTEGFLQRVAVDRTTWVNLPSSELPQALADNLHLWSKDVDILAIYSAHGTVPGIDPGTGRILDYDNPIVVVTEVGDLNDNFVLSAASSGNVLVSAEGGVQQQLQLAGYSDVFLSFDDTATQVRVTAQDAQTRYIAQIIGAVLLFGSVVWASVATARIALARERATIFAKRTAGCSWLHILRYWILLDVTIAVCAGVASIVGATLFGQSVLYGSLAHGFRASWMVAFMAFYVACVLFGYVRAGEREFVAITNREA